MGTHTINQPRHHNQGHLAKELVEAIREVSRIEQIVAERVQLRRSGPQFLGRCPFHSDKTPSFLVHPEKQVFRCHGCGAGGDVFAFTMKILNCSFPDAVKFLSKRAGIAVNGYRPSPELSAKVAAAQARRADEEAFKRWCDERIWAVTDAYRRLGGAALHAEDYLRHHFDSQTDPALHEMAWAALEQYIRFGERIEREGLLDVGILRAEWRARGGNHAAA